MQHRRTGVLAWLRGLIPISAGGVGARGRAGRGGCLLRLPAGRPLGPQVKEWLGAVLWVQWAEQPLNTSQSWPCVPTTAWPGRGLRAGAAAPQGASTPQRLVQPAPPRQVRYEADSPGPLLPAAGSSWRLSSRVQPAAAAAAAAAGRR